MRPLDLLLSDLVRDSKIETEFLGNFYQHVYYESGTSARERLIRREERWERKGFLGQGAYGTVYLERCNQGSQEVLRAVKEIKKFVVCGQELNYTRELEAIVKFSHKKYSHCFVKSDGWFELDDSIFITMEYLELGDLQRHLKSPLPELEALQITKQVLEGLGFMHGNGFVHRDIKPGNIMVVTKSPEWFVKIADFGISKRRHQDVTTLRTQIGTIGFAAPEVFGFENNGETSYTFAVDMWSLGAVAFRMLTNTTPFQSMFDLCEYVHHETHFVSDALEAHDVSETGRDFIARLILPKAQDRLSAGTAASHPWISMVFQPGVGSINLNNTDSVFDTEICVEATGISEASKDWSPESTISPINDMTARLAATQRYKSPTVENFVDECEIDRCHCLPVDSKFVLDISADHLMQEPSLWPAREAPPQVPGVNTGNTPPTLVLHSPNTPFEEVGDAKMQSTSPGSFHGHSNSNNGATTSQQKDSNVSDVNSDPGSCDTSDDEELCNHDSNPAINGANYLEADALEVDYDNPFEDIRAIRTPSPLPHTDDDIPGFQVDSLSQGMDDDSKGSPTERLAICDDCDAKHGFLTGPIEQLLCGHHICHPCLLERVALALLSPEYTYIRCCDDYFGEVDLTTFRRIILDSRVTEVWTRCRELADDEDWRCPRNHPPLGGSLLATRDPTVIWKQPVTCQGCVTHTYLPVAEHLQVPEMGPGHRRNEYCLYCSRQVGANPDNCPCGYPQVVNRLANGLKLAHGMSSPTGWVVGKIDRALKLKTRMANGEQLKYQTLGQLNRAPSPSPFMVHGDEMNDTWSPPDNPFSPAQHRPLHTSSPGCEPYMQGEYNPFTPRPPPPQPPPPTSPPSMQNPIPSRNEACDECRSFALNDPRKSKTYDCNSCGSRSWFYRCESGAYWRYEIKPQTQPRNSAADRFAMSDGKRGPNRELFGADVPGVIAWLESDSGSQTNWLEHIPRRNE